MPENNKHIKQYTAEDIQRYLSRQMPAQERHALEKAALEDPFLAEAIEGYTQRPAAGIVPDIEDLKKRLQQKTGSGKAAFLHSRKIWWSAAASVLIVLGGAFTWYWLTPEGNNIAQKKDTTAVPVKENRDTAKTPEVTGAADSAAKESSEEKSTSLSPVREKVPLVAPPPPPQRTKQVPAPLAKNDTIAPPPGFAETDWATTAQAQQQAQAIEESERKKSRTGESRNLPVSAAQNEAPAPAHINTISGKITDHNSTPLPFVNIRTGNAVSETYSDAHGNFKLISGNASLVANVSAAGFEPKEVVLYAGIPVNTIMLQPDTAQLREVVASAYEIKKKKAFLADKSENTGEGRRAAPADGWENYNIYLMNNTRSPGRGSTPVHGLVDVSFTVNKYGRLSGFKIIRSACSQCNQEAIRVIKEGPHWKLTGDTDTAKITITVQF